MEVPQPDPTVIPDELYSQYSAAHGMEPIRAVQGDRNRSGGVRVRARRRKPLPMPLALR